MSPTLSQYRSWCGVHEVSWHACAAVKPSKTDLPLFCERMGEAVRLSSGPAAQTYRVEGRETAMLALSSPTPLKALDHVAGAAGLLRSVRSGGQRQPSS